MKLGEKCLLLKYLMLSFFKAITELALMRNAALFLSYFIKMVFISEYKVILGNKIWIISNLKNQLKYLMIH